MAGKVLSVVLVCEMVQFVENCIMGLRWLEFKLCPVDGRFGENSLFYTVIRQDDIPLPVAMNEEPKV